MSEPLKKHSHCSPMAMGTRTFQIFQSTTSIAHPIALILIDSLDDQITKLVTAHDSESGRPGSNPEWGLIYYEASITAQGLPEPSSLRGSTLGTRAAEHKGCNWGMQDD